MNFVGILSTQYHDGKKRCLGLEEDLNSDTLSFVLSGSLGYCPEVTDSVQAFTPCLV
jgi:hypothetical protein